MVRMGKYGLLWIGIMLATQVFSQKLDGHWYGIGTLQTSGEYNGYLSELILQQKGKNVSGKFLYYFRDSLVTVPIRGNFDVDNNRLTINPFPVIYYLSPSAKNSIDCRLSGSFVLIASKTSSQLSGKLFPDTDHRYTVPDINYRLTRSDDTASWVVNELPELPEKRTDTLLTQENKPGTGMITTAKKPPSPIEQELPDSSVIKAFVSREKKYTRELVIQNPTLQIEIYDNGKIDYDSVSLFLNNRLVLPKSMLTHRAIRLTIELDPSLPFNELSMFAENLGMIPPNTAAMIVHDGKEKYEILLSSDLSKSATLKLIKKE